MQGEENVNIRSTIETLLFVSGEPVAVFELAQLLQITEIELNAELLSMREEYESQQRGILLQFINDKVQLCSNKLYAEYVKRMLQPEKTRTFSQSVIETLAIIAYKQPVTRADIEAIRGVRCEYSVSQLLSSGFIEEIGRKNAIGRPALFGTTDKFLQHFGISSVSELPDRKEFMRDVEDASVV